MMTNTKWLRRALLGGVALSVMASGAQADELSELKAQLEALQTRVGQLEQQPTTAAVLPEGANFITLTRGSADIPDDLDRNRMRDESPSERGFTIAVTPTADLPAPIAEVVLYGFVRANMSYDFDGIKSDGFYVPTLFSNPSRGNDHFRAHATNTRFGIRTRFDTAIGQIRSTIEGDFRGVSGAFRFRRGFGEWDMMPSWTLLIGQTQRTAVLIPIGVTTVDVSGSAGPNFWPRATQIRLTYHSGPISWAVAVERPTFESSAKWPNLSSYIQFDAPGGHQFILTGTVADYRDRPVNSDVGWAVQAGANINLADIATITVGGLYGKGEHCVYLLHQLGCGSGLSTFAHDPTTEFEFGVNPDTGAIELFPVLVPGAIDFISDEGWGIMAGLSFGLTDTTTFNVQYGLNQFENGLGGAGLADHVTTQTLHANIIWQPVRQMRLGWEVMWGEYRFSGGGDWSLRETRKSDDAIRATFGAWFFF
jgi:opacity protein-like surface antigen